MVFWRFSLYFNLHKSHFIKLNDDRRVNSDGFYTNQLLQLPLFYELSTKQQNQDYKFNLDLTKLFVTYFINFLINILSSITVLIT